MYINAFRDENQVIVWERDNANKRTVKRYPAPFYFYVKSSDGEYTSIYGEKLKKFEYDNARDFYNERNKNRDYGIKLYESDIPPEIKILSKHYYNVQPPKLNVTFFDIEVDYDLNIGYSSIENPYAIINAIAFYNTWENMYEVIAVPPDNYKTEINVLSHDELLNKLNNISHLPKEKIKITFFDTEKDLLMYFIDRIDNSDLLSGWNSDNFDIPYIGKRLLIHGISLFNRLSFEGAPEPEFYEIEENYRTIEQLRIGGRISLDYLKIFKKYEVVDRHSFALEAVSNDILIDKNTKKPLLPKLEYEGSLAELYRNDFYYFLRYNLRDVEILKGFEDVLGYVELSNQMVHHSTGLFQHVLGTTKLSEFSVMNYCHHEFGDLKIPDTEITGGQGKAKGAFVLIPQKGEHEWIASIDINSLYPSTIRSLNISPETLVGQFLEKETAFEKIRNESSDNITLELINGEKVSNSAKDWKQYFIENKFVVSGYGTVFSIKKQGIFPKILEDWYTTRKKYKKLLAEAVKKNDKNSEEKYDKLQYVYKIKLNSFYGALLNQYFKFYDKRMGESVTASSRNILLHQCAKVAEYVDGEYALPDHHEYDEDGKKHIGYSKKYSVIYGDTDSTYFKTNALNKEEAIKFSDTIGKLVNASFPEFMSSTFLCDENFNKIIQTEREIVSDKGIFVDKKRYFLHLINNDGKDVDKLKVMGLETKKTTIPKPVAEKINFFVEEYLKGKEWSEVEKEIVEYKTKLKETDNILDLAIPKGVKKVEYYTSIFNSGRIEDVPWHVRAVILYNMCLDQFNDKKSQKIFSGMKIKLFYLIKPLPYKHKKEYMKTIALPGDQSFVPEWFDNFAIDKDVQIQKIFDDPLENIIKVLNKKSPSKQSLFANEVLGL